MKIVMSSEDLPPLEITVWDKESGKEEFMGRYMKNFHSFKYTTFHFFMMEVPVI